jgi:hypothetical protein
MKKIEEILEERKTFEEVVEETEAPFLFYFILAIITSLIAFLFGMLFAFLGESVGVPNDTMVVYIPLLGTLGLFFRLIQNKIGLSAYIQLPLYLIFLYFGVENYLFT